MVYSPKLVARYRELKTQVPGCLLLMQVGSFMQVQDDDARAVAAVTGLKLQMVGEGVGAFERRAAGCRVTQSTVEALTGENQAGLTLAFNGQGIREEESAGSETHTAEDGELILPSEGTLSCQLGGVDLVTTVRGSRFILEGPLDTEDRPLFRTLTYNFDDDGQAPTVGVHGIRLTIGVCTVLDLGRRVTLFRQASETASDLAGVDLATLTREERAELDPEVLVTERTLPAWAHLITAVKKVEIRPAADDQLRTAWAQAVLS